ncbi:hypothetical protein [Burkholderia reimsis]|uniref:hypothetical protein n=1 Tax=Burkholderia reimsis TaxID=2234132 RepID=UPI0010586228|nr:hypothetical protein [Burkholderia reimsis]
MQIGERLLAPTPILTKQKHGRPLIDEGGLFRRLLGIKRTFHRPSSDRMVMRAPMLKHQLSPQHVRSKTSEFSWRLVMML